MCANALAEAFPHLLELYPLERFLSALLATLEPLAGSPVGCYVPSSRQLAVRREGKFLLEGASLDGLVGEARSLPPEMPSVLFPGRLGEGLAAAALADAGAARVIPCPILTRSVGFLLLPLGSLPDTPELSLLARLTGFYLHRHEIETGISRRFKRDLVIMGCSPWIFDLQEDLERYAPLNEPLLILGESGSGKEVFAEAVHILSPRRAGPLVAVNCAAAPSDNLLVDEFFGHRRGAFTGAAYDKQGCCQEADKGTLFLDEIGDMSHELQTLLLRTLSTGDVRRIGDAASTRVDIRLVSATHRDLLGACDQRRFRADLFYRISAFQLRIPPLRERSSDIPFLAGYVLHRFAEANGLPRRRLTARALQELRTHPWPGNIRELENVLKRAFVRAEGDVIDSDDLRFDGGPWPRLTALDSLSSELRHGRSFWEAVVAPYRRRAVTREDVALLVAKGLQEAHGSLKELAASFNLEPREYPRFVAFLHRHGFRDEKSERPSPEGDEG